MTRPRHGCSVAGFAIVTLLTLAASPAPGQEIRLWPTAIASGDTVTLSDVAQIRGFSAADKALLIKLVIHASPRPGGSVLIRSSDIRDAAIEAQINFGQVRLFGASRCKATRPRAPRREAVRPPSPQRTQPTRPPARLRRSELVPAGGLESRMRQFIAARMQDGGEVEVTFSPACRKALALSSPRHRFRILPQDKRRLGLLSFDVEVRTDGAPPRTVPIAAEAVLVKDVVVARRSINQGQVIAGRDLKLQERRFTRMDAVGITDLVVAVGSLSGRFYRPGDMLDARGLKSQPMVRRGERVEILIVADGIEIKTSGKAQASGALGDSIAVRRDGSRRRQDVIDAVVTGPGVVVFRGERRVTRR